MKRTIKLTSFTTIVILSFIVFNISSSFSQNLVPNPSFEDTIHCPSNLYTFGNTIQGWKSYCCSPDYFNSCSTWSGVPSNYFGYQYASDGNAYCGLFAWQCTTLSCQDREYLGIQLSSPLIIGTKYYVSLKACLTIKHPFNCAVNNLGVLFSTFSHIDSLSVCNHDIFMRNYAHVYSSAVITDTANWTTISGSFIADSTYQYVVIGNFFDDARTTLLPILDTTVDYSSNAYYLVDNLIVSTDSTLVIRDFTDGTMGSISIFPNPASTLVNVRLNSSDKNAVLYIYNDLGQPIFIKQKIPRHATIDISDIPSGILFIQIIYNNQIKYYKLIKS